MLKYLNALKIIDLKNDLLVSRIFFFTAQLSKLAKFGQISEYRRLQIIFSKSRQTFPSFKVNYNHSDQIHFTRIIFFYWVSKLLGNLMIFFEKPGSGSNKHLDKLWHYTWVWKQDNYWSTAIAASFTMEKTEKNAFLVQEVFFPSEIFFYLQSRFSHRIRH